MEYRVATDDDNATLIALSRNSPQRGVVTVYTDRSPDYFEFTRIQGESTVWVVQENNEIIACVATHCDEVMYEGKPVRLLAAGDLHVHPEAQRRGVGKDLTAFVYKQAVKDGSHDMGKAEIIAKNAAPLRITQRMSEEFCPTVHAGQARCHQLLPVRRYRVPSRYAIRPATWDDLQALAGLLTDTYQGYNMAPLFAPAKLRSILSTHESFGIESVWVAEEDGELVACAAFWDQESLRRMVVQSYDSKTRLAIAAMRVLGPVFRLPRPPELGEPLRNVFLRFPACKPEFMPALQALLRHQNNRLIDGGMHHFLAASFHHADPMQACVAGIWKLTMNLHLFHCSIRDQFPLLSQEEAPSRPTYVDLTLV